MISVAKPEPLQEEQAVYNVPRFATGMTDRGGT